MATKVKNMVELCCNDATQQVKTSADFKTLTSAKSTAVAVLSLAPWAARHTYRIAAGYCLKTQGAKESVPGVFTNNSTV